MELEDAKRPGLYLIEILHQTTTCRRQYGLCRCCILSKFYIKPQHDRSSPVEISGCILSKFYIKPQLFSYAWPGSSVVSYRNSTSNHNSGFAIKSATPVVSYRNSTSNHNSSDLLVFSVVLYLIEILHQTTTLFVCLALFLVLYLIEILHQTTTFCESS